ncbi:MAG: NRDE family protein, partial [Phycisphaerales bacterium]|nr:NRDE family protein [Phycisphaerales bacterium]
MCTLSIIEISGGGYRAVQNRDEQRSRGMAYPPAWRTLDSGVRVQYPTDSDAGGTWIAVSGAGVTTGVLNYKAEGKSNPDASQSRGEIPLMLIEHSDLDSMLNLLQGMDMSVYACFTGFGIVPGDDGVRVMIVQWDGTVLHVVRDGTEGF